MNARSSRIKPPTTEPNLQDQVLLLRRENARLKEMLHQHGLLQPSNPESNQNGSSPSPKTPSSSDVSQVTPKRKAGCSCQGKCATRVCGCVKKQMPCGEFCRCADDQCQNQEPDKENIGEQENQALSEAGQESLRKLANLSIHDKTKAKAGKSGRSDKRVENVSKKPGLFSPPTSTTGPILDIRELASEPLTFGRDPDTDTSTTNHNEIFENHAPEENRNKSKTAGRLPGRSRRQNLVPAQSEERSRSASSREQEEDEPSARAKKGRNRRTTSLGESGNEKVPKEKNNKTLAAVLNGTKPLRRAAAAKLGEASASIIEDPEANNKKVEEVNKKAKTAKGKSKKKVNSNAKPTDEERAEVNELLKVVANNIQLVAAQQMMQVEPQVEETTPHAAEVVKPEPETHPNENIQVDNIKTERPQIDFFPLEDDSVNFEQSPSNSSPTFGQLPIDDPDFDPMKPRHNLTRSPLGPHTQIRTFLDVSERPLVPPVEEAAEELPPPEELNNIIVDWDKHQQERVYCSKCKRGFYPYRIKKHEATCKKV